MNTITVIIVFFCLAIFILAAAVLLFPLKKANDKDININIGKTASAKLEQKDGSLHISVRSNNAETDPDPWPEMDDKEYEFQLHASAHNELNSTFFHKLKNFDSYDMDQKKEMLDVLLRHHLISMEEANGFLFEDTTKTKIPVSPDPTDTESYNAYVEGDDYSDEDLDDIFQGDADFNVSE